MSRWTHIVGSLYIDTYEERKDIESFVRKIVKKAPKITGSEKDAEVYVKVLDGHNSWTNCDCEHCEYGKTIVHLEEGGFQCDAPEGYECPEGKYQSCLVITIVGDLRDRSIDITGKETINFLKFIETQGKGWEIDYHSICIYDELIGKFYLKEDREWLKM